MQRKRLDFEFKQRYDDKIKGLEREVSDLDKVKKDLRKRLNRIHGEHKELAEEFTKFRNEKAEQEGTRNKQYKALEDRIASLQVADAEQMEQLNKQIEVLENSKEVSNKENSILQMKQKYLKQQTETLAKQKVFMSETINKGRQDIKDEIQKLENAMLADNNNQDYMLSVKKCIEKAKYFADMGNDSLSNLSQILNFLKIEKLHGLLSDDNELEQLEQNMIKHISDDRQVAESATKPEQIPALGVQKFLTKHGLADNQQSQVSPTPTAVRR